MKWWRAATTGGRRVEVGGSSLDEVQERERCQPKVALSLYHVRYILLTCTHSCFVVVVTSRRVTQRFKSHYKLSHRSWIKAALSPGAFINIMITYYYSGVFNHGSDEAGQAMCA